MFDSASFDVASFSDASFQLAETVLVEVPDVVGQTQASGTAELEGVAFVVSVQNAYSGSVAAGDIISQSPTAGTQRPEGSVVFIVVSLGPEPISENKGAGKPKRRRRYVVEIDGRDFEVSGPDEAVALLGRAKEVAAQQIEKALAAPTRISRGIPRPRIATAAPELKQVVAQARREITSLYDQATRDLEIAALLRKADEEEEENLIRLLM
jgi:hypothetical protein